MIARALFGIVLAASCVPVLAAMYKWVDDKGVTHYTEEPPADRKSVRIDIAPGPAAPAQSAEEWRKKDQDARKQRIDKEQAEDKSKEATNREAAMRANRCQLATRQLQALNAQRPVFTVNEKGEQVFLEDKERAAAIERYTKDLGTHCDIK
jgi:hypothetical protein